MHKKWRLQKLITCWSYYCCDLCETNKFSYEDGVPVTTPAQQQYPVKMQGLLILYQGLDLSHIEGGLVVHPGKENNFSIIMVVTAFNQTKVWYYCHIVDQKIILKEIISTKGKVNYDVCIYVLLTWWDSENVIPWKEKLWEDQQKQMYWPQGYEHFKQIERKFI